MFTKVFVAAFGLAGVAGAASAADMYTDSASFLANVAPGYSFNGFGDASVSGLVLSYNLNGFAYDITASGTFQNFASINAGELSASVLASIVITFSGGNVTAVGGNFWSDDGLSDLIALPLQITLSDGTDIDFTASSETEFRGFTSDVPITSIRIDPYAAGYSYAAYWAVMDNLYVGTAAIVPLPPAAWAGLGVLGVSAGVRRWRRRG